MVVGDLDIEGVPIFPSETDSPLIDNADTVLPRTITLQRFQAVAGRYPQILQRYGIFKESKFAPLNVDTYRYMRTIYGTVTQRTKVKVLLQHSPVISSSEITVEGIDTKTLTRMVEDGEIRRIARGLYTSVDYIPATYHSLIEASKLVENGVVCLLSALSFHEIGTRNPSEVWIAIPRRARMPQVQAYPIRIVRFSGEAYGNGVERCIVDGVEMAIYNIPKTVADCFKYRNKIGLDMAIEALKDVIRNKRASIDDLIHFAGVCRVREIMRPYMESIV